MTTARYDLVGAYVYRMTAGLPEFLLIHRSADRRFGNTWSVVYGSSLPGETAAQAACREMLEETGLQPERLHCLNSVNTFYLAAWDELYHCPTFAAEVAPDAQACLNEEHDAFAWLDAASAKSRLIWAAQRQAVDEIVQEIIKGGPARTFLEMPI